MQAFKKVASVVFPEPSGIDINMMPLKLGDRSTWSPECFRYESMLTLCDFPLEEVCYLSIHEAVLAVDETLRRPGIHTEATPFGAWGGGEDWNGKNGIYQSSTDGRCQIWNETTNLVSISGSLTYQPESEATVMEANELYWMTDRTPHESLPVKNAGWRQWFRLVSPEIALWWSNHSTASPMGLVPPESVKIIEGDKFKWDPANDR